MVYVLERCRRRSINSRVIILLISINALTLALCFSTWGRPGLLVGLAFSAFFTLIFLHYSESRLLRILQAKPLDGSDAWGLNSTSEKLANRIRQPLPSIWAFESVAPTVLCLGSSWDPRHILFSTSLLERFDEQEFAATLSLCMAYLQVKQRPWTGVIIKLNLFLGALGQTVDTLLLAKLHGFRPMTLLLRPLMWTLISSVINSRVMYQVDRRAGETFSNPLSMAQTILKLEAYSQSHPLDIPMEWSHTQVVSSLTERSQFRYLPVHPTARRRIEKLVGYYPI